MHEIKTKIKDRVLLAKNLGILDLCSGQTVSSGTLST